MRALPSRLPVEMIRMISKEKDGMMARSEEEECMTRLIAERTIFVDNNTDGSHAQLVLPLPRN